jgi:formylglycine-generating enzyme required for sulfatase activity
LDSGQAAAYFVSWNMAAHFANQWSTYNNIETCYLCEGLTTSVECSPREDIQIEDCKGYRLPTEAEWELAARSGTKSEFWTGQGGLLGGMYDTDECNGDAQIIDNVDNPFISSFAWYCGNNETDGPKEVGLLEPNGYGIYDMHGNIWEWTHSSRGDFPDPSQDPSNTDNTYRVLRGGGFHNNPYDIRVSYRGSYVPTKRLSGYGFRLARSIE